MSTLLSGKKLSTFILNLEKGVKTMKDMIDLGVRSALYHHVLTGDVTPINQICKVTESVVSKNAVRTFIDNHGCVTWGGKEVGFKHSPERLEKRAGAAKVDALTAEQVKAYHDHLLNVMCYYEATKPDDDFKPMSVPSMLKAIATRYEKMSDEEKADERNNFEGLNEALQLAEKFANAAPSKKASKKAEAKASKALAIAA